MTDCATRVPESKSWLCFMAAVLTLISLTLLSALPLAADRESKAVLTIYSDERLMPANQVIDAALRDTLGLQKHNLTYFSEFLDFTRFGSPAYDKVASNFLRDKYALQPIDVIVAVGPLALQFLYCHQADLFPGVPVVLLGTNRGSLQSQKRLPNFLGVPTTIEPLPTIDLALRLQPDAREIVVVTGTSEFDRAWEVKLRAELPHRQASLTVRFLSGLALNDVLRELSRLSPKSIGYFAVIFPGRYRNGIYHG